MISLIYRCQIAGQCPLLFYAMYAQYAPGRHPKHRPGKRNHLFNRAPKSEINLREDSVRELMLADGTRLVLDAGGGETAAAPAPERPAPENGGAPYQDLIGGPVAVTLENGERHRGTLVDVDGKRVTLSVAMGSGKVEYFYDLGNVASIEETQ